MGKANERVGMPRISTASFIASIVIVSAIAVPSHAAPSRGITLTAPYAGDWATGGCYRNSDNVTKEICRAFPYASALDGSIGAFTEVQSTNFGEQPALRSNEAYIYDSVTASGRMRRSAGLVTVTVHLQVDGATASFTGTDGTSSTPASAFASVGASFTSWPCGCAYGYSPSRVVLDADPATPAPSEFTGEILITFQVYSVPQGDFSVNVNTTTDSRMTQGDTGRVEAWFPATITSIEVTQN